ncbi:MAG: hypothetical protein B7Z60_04440 [Ferrovum sp. 37-45-19]|nr:MAG: hypothetical protein B7Z65_02215 [Ferrovum sp. 21-44-67]OYV94437.1 MAG: hypothetical protein B7Z60_04440 [Ferrovum sp. 37-45-19]OZB32420.1 MAG: hypothetical protein B7X47_06205 [Ferrovum sp. 34-44-207]
MFADPIENLQSLIAQKRFSEAFDLGLRYPQLSGNSRFDYYYSIAAIDSGHAAIGITNLERLISIEPDNVSARLELARAYFLFGDYESAKSNFNIVLNKNNLPADIKKSVYSYLDAIRQNDPLEKTVKSGYANFTIGLNSNVVSSSLLTQTSWYYQILDPFYLKTNYGQQSSFSQTDLGYSVSGQLVSSLRYLVDVGGDYRKYSLLSSFDQRTTSTGFGLEYSKNDNNYTVITHLEEDGLNGGDLRSVYSIKAQWDKNLNRNTTLSSNLTYSLLRYNNLFSPIYDSNMTTFTVGAQQWVGGHYGVKLDMELVGAQQNNIRTQNDLSRDIIGGRFGINSLWTSNLSTKMILGYFKSNYWASQPSTLSTNNPLQDRFLTVDFHLRLKLDKSLSLIGSISKFVNNSTYTYSDFSQQEYSAGLNYEW